MFILGGILLLIIGVLMFCFPDAVYSITELWKSDYSGKPSDAYTPMRWANAEPLPPSRALMMKSILSASVMAIVLCSLLCRF